MLKARIPACYTVTVKRDPAALGVFLAVCEASVGVGVSDAVAQCLLRTLLRPEQGGSNISVSLSPLCFRE